MFKGHKSLRSIIIASLLLVATAVTATASWTGYLNPIAYFESTNGSQVSEHASSVGSLMVVNTCDVATAGNPIEVESTLPSGPTAYANLGAAFAAINAGTHQGTINIEVCFNSTETAATVLNSSGAGSANYTSISIRPLADGLTISGPTVTGRGLIELNGADNVTIDGDNPNTAGTNRNLTIQNTAANTITYAQVIRIALATTVITSADNVTIKNLNLLGNATGRNISTATSSSASENVSYGIYASGGASTVSQTTAPSAISSTSTTIGSGATASNLTIQNNFVNSAARGVAIQGAATTVFPGLLIEGNTVGNATAAATSQVYSMGITAQGSTNAILRSNTVYVESYVGASVRGIDFGGISATGSGATFERNVVGRVYGRNTSGFGSYGINIVSGNNNIVRNNFVYDVNAFLTNSGISTTFGSHGIRITTGTGHQVFHNSVNLFGAVLGSTTISMSSALTLVSTASTGMDVRNNILVNTQTGAFAGTPVDCIYLPSGATSAMNLTINNNDYYSNGQLGQQGTTAISGFTIAAFDPSTTAGATNWRNYTSTLSAAGTNDNASKKVDPVFVSSTDLHIQSSSTMESAGANASVTTDIDGDARGATPDIGADEITLAGPGTVQFSATSYTDSEGNTATITVNRTGGSSGAISVDYATSNSGGSVGGATCTAGVDYISASGTLNWADTDTAAKTFNVTLCNDSDSPETGEAVSLTLSNAVGTSITGTNPVPLNITDVPAMTYVSSTSTQVTGDAQLGGANQAIIGIQVVTTGSYLPLSVTQLNLSTNGSTAASDIANAKVYYTGTSSTFATGTQFGSTVASPSGAFNVTGTQALVAGTNYFWLAYDIAPTATVNNFVDAEVSSITVGSSQTPTVTAPAGNRQIKAVVTIPGANTNTGSQRYPLATYYGFQRSAAIYTSAELGLAPGSTIQNMCWYVNSSSSPGNAPTKIYMKTVTNSTFSAATTVANEEAGAMLTYNATPTLTYTANTWQCLALSTPFVYTGNNLQVLVETDQGSAGNEGSAAKQFRYSTAASAHQFWENDTAPPTGVSTTWSVGGISSNRPNIQFNFAAPIVAPGTVQFNPAAYTPNEGVVQTVTVTRTSGTAGAVSVDYATGGGTATPGTCGTDDYVATSGTLNWADGETGAKTFNITICPDAVADPGETFEATLSNPTGGVTIGGTNPAVVTITDTPPPLSGTYNIPSGTYTSLTNPGGIFEALNASGATSNITINIDGDLLAETGTHSLNEIAGGYSVIVQPSGSARTIEGTNSTALINLNGADNVVFTGTPFGSNGLTFRNMSAGTGSVFRFVNDASTNGIVNCLIEQNNTGSTAILFSTGTTTGNDDNQIDGVTVRGTSSTVMPFNSIASVGTSSAVSNGNLNITNNTFTDFGQAGVLLGSGTNTATVSGNDISQTASRTTQIIGIISTGTTGTQVISGNKVHSLTSNSSSATGGIVIGNSTASVSENRIYDIQTTASATGFIFGIEFDGVSGGTPAATVVNNFVSIAPTVTTDQVIMGIRDYGYGGNIFTADHNSVYIGGTGSGSSSSWALVRGDIAPTTFTARNNIAFNNRTGGSGNHFAGGDQSAGTGAFVSNGNFYAGTGATPANFMDYGSSSTGTPVSFATYQAGPPARDAASSGNLASSYTVSNIFVNALAGDLHLTASAGVDILSAGIALGSVTNDIDLDPRPATAPDKGADEIVQAEGGIIPGGTFYNAYFNGGDTLAGNVTVTNKLYLNGINVLGANVLTLGCNASVSGAGATSFIDGAVKKDFCATGAFEFPVGQNQYSKVGVTITALGTNPSSLTVTPWDATLGGFDPNTSLSRNWNLEETGDLTADLLFYYDDTDVIGGESAFRAYKRAGNGVVTPECVGPCVDDVNNILGPVTGVTSFSRWTGAGPLAPTAADVSLGGRVTTADGRGVTNAVIVLSGNSLPQPIMVKTGSFGYYRFENLEAGETYVVTVNSKRFTFSVPSRVVSVPDNVSNIDFVAMPE